MERLASNFVTGVKRQPITARLKERRS